MAPMTDEYGFTVQRDGDEWYVYLPHQCDEWDIAGEREDRAPVSHAEAVAALRGFLAEGQAALARLEQGGQR
jgi:hypothetical protein